jgi:acetate kinase
MNKKDTILVVNVGSTSFKYKLFNMEKGQCLARGKIENVFTATAEYTWKNGLRQGKEILDASAGYGMCIQRMIELLTDKAAGVIPGLNAIGGVGFKAVLAGRINYPVKVTQQLLREMGKYAFAAPAHNPPYIEAMQTFSDRMPGIPLVASFETGFHRTIPEAHYVYALPQQYREKYGLRKYGFHGASHGYVAWKISQRTGREDLRIISCHLGGSSSLCAIQNGKSLDTTMGFSPQAGIPNNNRNGDLDVFAVLYLMEQEKLTPLQMREILSTNSGLLGLSGISGDMRVLKKSEDPRAKLTIDHLVYCVKKYLGGLFAEMNGADVITFSGGIGENDSELRQKICENMDCFGIRLNQQANQKATGELPADGVEISAPNSKIKIIVLPTNEEWMVAMNTRKVIEQEEQNEMR